MQVSNVDLAKMAAEEDEDDEEGAEGAHVAFDDNLPADDGEGSSCFISCLTSS